ncbi:hypothetical protein K493DRAFT_316001, partial [Basidiobolus meristosporus CBS 931.73]
MLLSTQAGRLLCVSNIRGNYSFLNQLIKSHEAVAVLHCGEFGIHDTESYARMSESSLRSVIKYSPLLSKEDKAELNNLPIESLRKQPACLGLSQFPAALSGAFKFDAPVFTIHGVHEDPAVLRKLLDETITIPQLHILHCGGSNTLEIGGNRIRLLGISGDYSPQQLFAPERQTSDLFVNLVRIGKLMETAQKVYDPSEVRILMMTASPTKHTVLAQLAHTLNADYTIAPEESAQYCISYNETSTLSDPKAYHEKLIKARSALMGLWEKARVDIEKDYSSQEIQWIKHGLSALNDLPETESLLERFWAFGLPELTKGSLILDISDGFIAAETKSTGIYFGHRLKNAFMLKPKDSAISNVVTNGIQKPMDNEVSKPTLNLQNEPVSVASTDLNGGAPKQENNATTEEQKGISSWDDVVADEVGQMNWDEPVFDGPMNWDEDLPENISKGHMIDWSEDVYEENGSWVDLNPPSGTTAASVDPVPAKLGADDATKSNKLGMGASASVWADSETAKSSTTSSGEPYTLWVGGFNKIPYTEEDVKSIFGSLRNSISQVKLVHDRHTGQQRAFCFVDFKDADSMERGHRKDGCEWNNGILKINRAEHREQTFSRPRVQANTSRRTDGHYDDTDPSRTSYRGRGRSRGRGRGRNFSFD